MSWDEAIRDYLPVTTDKVDARKIMRFIDLTSLNEADTESSVMGVLSKACNPLGQVAAVCVYPRFIPLVSNQLANSSVRTATVVNFPHGTASLASVLDEIDQAVQDGADEIDLVFPYHRYLAGSREWVCGFIQTCKAACRSSLLKVILETGAFSDLNVIAEASHDVLSAGADFIKTSTGKTPANATLEAAAVMLLVAKTLNRNQGVKVSGGIKSAKQAFDYLMLAERIRGSDGVTPKTFRLGASRLVDELLDLS